MFTQVKSPMNENTTIDPFANEQDTEQISDKQIQHMEREAGDGQNDLSNEKDEWQDN